MDIRFAAPDVRRLSQLKSEALVLPFFSDDRPLRGVTGLVDWRLCGQLSRLCSEGFLQGARKETLLVPCGTRMSLHKLFLFGLGPRAEFDIRCFDDISQHILSTLQQAQIRSFVSVLPGREAGMEPRIAITRFLQNASKYPDMDELIILDDPLAQQKMSHVVDGERRRARATAPEN